MDLSDFYQRKRYRSLMQLIDQLPRTSRYYEAMTKDPEFIQARLELESVQDEAPDDEETGDSWHPSTTEFGLTEQLLRELLHSVQEGNMIAMQAAGGKPPKPKPFPAPLDPLEVARADADIEYAVRQAEMFGFKRSDVTSKPPPNY